MTALPTSKTTLNYSGSAVTYTAQADGLLSFKLWAGSGGTDQFASSRGGCSAGVIGEVFVKNGDTVEFVVGQGGRGGSGSGDNLGGYPNGGNGRNRGAGGGGRTQLKINGAAVAICGAGGGSGQGGGIGPGGTYFAPAGSGTFGAMVAAGGWFGQNGYGVNQTGASLQGGNAGTNSWGGGGGDGYFGGSGGGGTGGGGDNTGAGGNSYLSDAVQNRQWAMGDQGGTHAGLYGDSDYPAGAGLSSATGGHNGGDGAAVIVFEASGWSYSPLPTVKTTINYSGADVLYEAQSTGYINAKLWGAAGGADSGGDKGAPGGFVDVASAAQINVSAGDIIRVVVGQGGAKSAGSASIPTKSYPNGGAGNGHGGDGGGSTAIYVNGVLQAIAGAGGGAGPTTSGWSHPVGVGGDFTQGGDVHNGGTPAVYGATSSAAGYRSNKPTTPDEYQGAHYYGGHGGYNSWAGGGGGGYYGGGGNDGASQDAGGSGGSSYASGAAISGTPTATAGTNAGTTPGGSGDADYPGGSIGASGSSSDGGDGALVLVFTGTGASGDYSLTTTTISAGTWSTTVSVEGDYSLSTINLSGPTWYATGDVKYDFTTLSIGAPNFIAEVPATARYPGETITVSPPAWSAHALATPTYDLPTITGSGPAWFGLATFGSYGLAASPITIGAPTFYVIPNPYVTELDVAALAVPPSHARVAELDVAALALPPSHARVAELDVAALAIPQTHTAPSVAELDVAALVYVGPCATERAQMWLIKRRDGVVLGFTSLDTPITWRGVAFSPCKSLTESATHSTSEINAEGDVELQGILDDGAISASDMYAGLYDDAYVEVWTIPYGDPYTNDDGAPFRAAAGWTGKVSRNEFNFTAEVLGPGARIKQTGLVAFYTAGCKHSFGVLDGDGIGCPVDAEALKVAGVAVTAANGRQFVLFSHSAPGGSTVWNQGRVRWLTGRNAGVECMTDTVDFAAGALSLWDIAPYPPQAGDTFDLLPGCPKTTPACQTYGVYDSFGGYPDIPGPDALQSNADSMFTGN